MSQTTYTQNPAVAVEGLVHDGATENRIVSGIASEVIAFGRAVARVANADNPSDRPPTVQLTQASTDITTGIFVGITCNDVTLEAGSGYPLNHVMRILRVGWIWVLAEDAVTFGGAVFARFTADTHPVGRLRSDADTDEAVEIPGATWRSTTTGADEFAIVELQPTL